MARWGNTDQSEDVASVGQSVWKSKCGSYIYVSGIGTEHDLGGLNSALDFGVSLQASQTMISIVIIKNHPDAKLVFTDISFSRSSGVIRAV